MTPRARPWPGRARAAGTGRREAARFQTAFENASVGASMTDQGGRLLAANPAFCAITGYARECLIGASFAPLIHPEDRPALLKLRASLVAGLIPSYWVENRMVREGGQSVWVRTSVSVTRDASGRPEHLLALTEDITARRAAAQAQTQAEARTDQLLAVGAALGGALTADEVAGVILEAALPMFRASAGLIALLSDDGTTLRSVRTVGTPPARTRGWREVGLDAPIAPALAVRERRLVAVPDAEGGPEGRVLLAVPLLAGDRCVGSLALTVPAVAVAEAGPDRESHALLWTLAGQCALALERARLSDETRRELAERRRAEEETARLAAYNRLLLESAAEGIYGMDTEGRCTFLNPAAARLLGYAPEEALGLGMHALIHHTRADGTPCAVGECPIYQGYRLGQPCHVDTEVLWRRDGTSFPAAYSSYPMLDAGELVGAVITFSDISERRAREAAQARALREAQDRADRDPLTGLVNHRAFFSRLDEEAARAGRSHTSLALVLLDVNNFRLFNDAHGHAAGDGVLRLVAGRLHQVCRPYDTVARFGGDEFALLLPGAGEATADALEARLRADLAGLTHCLPGGAEIPVTASVGAALLGPLGPDRPEALRLAGERLLRAKTGGESETEADRVRRSAQGAAEGFSMLDALVTAVDNKDRYTRRHSEDVMGYSLLIARGLGMDARARQAVAVAALLHDVGKIGVPDHILRKPDRLSEAEFGAVKQHPQMGAIIVGAVPGFEDALDAIRHHHERWDGGGYPFGLAGEETPPVARIMAVADAFSAMTTDRPYRLGMGRARASAILQGGAGTQWDPDYVRVFLRELSRPEGGGTAAAPAAGASPSGLSSRARS